MCTHWGRKTWFLFQFTIDKGTTGLEGVSKRQEECTHYHFLGFQVDHMVSELLDAKNLSKRAKKCQKWQNLGCFLFLAALKPHGWPGIIKIKFL